MGHDVQDRKQVGASRADADQSGMHVDAAHAALMTRLREDKARLKAEFDAFLLDPDAAGPEEDDEQTLAERLITTSRKLATTERRRPEDRWQCLGIEFLVGRWGVHDQQAMESLQIVECGYRPKGEETFLPLCTTPLPMLASELANARFGERIIHGGAAWRMQFYNCGKFPIVPHLSLACWSA